MFYIPNNTYKNISPIDSRYDALLNELAFQSKEIQKMREQAASFSDEESGIAKRKLRKLVGSIMRLRGQNTIYA
ncbi:MAG: hypothetical protein WAP23_03185 [Candidatus Spechtbacterales bacterium]